MGNSVLTVTKENFDQEVLQSEQPVMAISGMVRSLQNGCTYS